MEIWKLVDPNPGDHIRIACSNYYHHGIYIGDEQVVEFGEASSATVAQPHGNWAY